MKASRMNPVLKNKMQVNNNATAGDVFKEIEGNEVGAKFKWGTLITTLCCYAASYALNNPGQVCTWTVECQKNC